MEQDPKKCLSKLNERLYLPGIISITWSLPNYLQCTLLVIASRHTLLKVDIVYNNLGLLADPQSTMIKQCLWHIACAMSFIITDGLKCVKNLWKTIIFTLRIAEK